jgi:hypothetical protein
MNTEPFTKSQIFSLFWVAIIVAYLFAGPRGFGPVPVPVSLAIISATVFSLIVLGKRFPWFGYFLVVLISSLLSGGRRRRW